MPQKQPMRCSIHGIVASAFRNLPYCLTYDPIHLLDWLSSCGSEVKKLNLCAWLQTLNYLKVVYKAEWANFVERIITSKEVNQYVQENGITLPAAADISPATFSQGGELHGWLHEMLSFASMRGQLLQRTVHGMMYYETALQQLILMQCRSELAEHALIEADRCGVPLRDRNKWVQQVCEEAALLLAQKKFSYVVSR
eukprot:GHUV01040099.1.p1 GENE.GHUV01040099.1~~GHUV01040099.1.p1  ORF type:complete len:197 (-),score=54.73 GHUV01040099.1:402-992(-)